MDAWGPGATYVYVLLRSLVTTFPSATCGKPALRDLEWSSRRERNLND